MKRFLFRKRPWYQDAKEILCWTLLGENTRVASFKVYPDMKAGWPANSRVVEQLEVGDFSQVRN